MSFGGKAKVTAEPPIERGLDIALGRPAANEGRACLMVMTGEAEGAVYMIDRRVLLIGRSAEAHIRINEHAISTEHALLESDEDTYTLRDLGSTNGTHVNGRPITHKVVLGSGDTIQMGSTVFLFAARASSLPDGTIRLRPARTELEVIGPTRPPAAPASPGAIRATGEHTASISLTDVVKAARRYWGYARRYGWIVGLGLGLGAGAGGLYTYVKPPAGSAWFEMTLSGPARTEDGESHEPFVGAENTFRSLPLIKKTLTGIGIASPNDGQATSAQMRLTFRPVAYNSRVYRGEYEDASAERAAAFLTLHLQTYVDSELDKLLRVLRTDAEFDRREEQKASERVAAARARLVDFSERYPQAVPKDATLPEPPAPRPTAGSLAPGLDQNIAATERALRAALLGIQTRKASPYLEAAAAAETKIADARARGLRDQHPELKSLLDLQASMRQKANAALETEPGASDRAQDPEVARLEQQLAEQRAARAKLGATVPLAVAPASARPKAVARPAQSLAQLRIEYGELAREYDRAKVEHDALMKKSESTARQLERERTSAEARYDVITPPTPAKKPLPLVLGKRAGFGAAVGLLVALVIAAGLELRRVLISRGHL
jgi:pSer/pThr/pTyr-binding forkhead associated (FHA) protein